MKDFLKSILGLNGKTEAYHNRKKGRKKHENRIQDLKRLIAYIQNKQEVTPGELYRELGMSRSTLTYTLNWLLKNMPGVQPPCENAWDQRLVKHLLGEKRLERIGAGQSVRYRLVDMPQVDSPMEPTQPKQESRLEAEVQGASTESPAGDKPDIQPTVG